MIISHLKRPLSSLVLLFGVLFAAGPVYLAAGNAPPDATEAPAKPPPTSPAVADPSVEAPTPRGPLAKNDAAALVVRGRSQYLAGDSAAAAETFHRVEAIDAGNKDALIFLKRLEREGRGSGTERARTGARMIEEVDNAWQRPGVPLENEAPKAVPGGTSSVFEKLDRIVLPEVNFSGMELSRVVNTLGAISQESDPEDTAPRGVNIVLLDPANANPTVTLTLRNLSLRRVLDFITDAVGYQYEVQADAVVLRPGGEQTVLATQFFPVSRPTVLRMTGKGAALNPPTGGRTVVAAAATMENEGQALRNFLQLAGVAFEGVPGSTLAFDGSQMIVTQTPRNLERIRNILKRYSEIRQVEIEAKFMEVQQGALEELGVQWNLAKKATQHTGATVSNYATNNRTLAQAFTSNNSGTQGAIIRPGADTVNPDGTTSGTGEINLPIINNPPPIPGTNNVGLPAGPLATITGILGEFDVNAVVRALSQQSGTELLSAPKLTVLSGNPATITVAQELRYPQSFGQVQSQVGTGSASGGGSAGVAITAGTPQEFTTRNVGVELRVTPTVEEDNHSISLDLNPKVTEFEGFVEYGGQSVAVSGGTTVTVPSGFFQPIFAVREVTTKVTIWDGATLVMGGLTREDVKKVSDKVPVLGSIPGLGRLFRSRGESTQKRNLLIFVTANLVNPGGALRQPVVDDLSPDTFLQTPPSVIPPGAASRGK